MTMATEKVSSAALELDLGIAKVLPALPSLDPAVMTPEGLRTELRRLAAKRPKPDLPRAVTRSDEQLRLDDRTIGLRIYRPEAGDNQGNLPVIVFFHGGGWVAGDIETHDAIAANLSSSLPAILVSVDYRRPPESPFPAAYEDCLAATKYVEKNLSVFSESKSGLAVAGDSAGGNLAAAVAIACAEQNIHLRGQLLIYPALDMRGLYSEDSIDRLYPSRRENASGYYLTTSAMHWFSQYYIRTYAESETVAASPLIASVPKKLAPVVLCTAQFDPLRDEGVAYVNRLRAVGIQVVHHPGPALIHGYFSFTKEVSPAAAREVARACVDFAALLGIRQC